MARTDRTPIADRFWSKVQKGDGCWLWTGTKDRRGYGQIARGGKLGGHTKAHRVAYELQHGPIPEGLGVLHRCDTPACVRGDHLFAGTQLDNMRDAWTKGRGRVVGAGRRGSANGNHRLSDDQVRSIYQRHKQGESSRKLGREFGVSKTLVLLISSGKTWQHITGASS